MLLQLQIAHSFAETLRKYPPLATLNRTCGKRYEIPNSDKFIEEGIEISIPVSGIHTDPEYYPNPDKYDPERFTAEEISKRPQYTYFPFGEGPRKCIGTNIWLDFRRYCGHLHVLVFLIPTFHSPIVYTTK